MLGKLTWAAIPFDQPIPLAASGLVVIAMLAVLVWVVVKGHVPYLWREWITSVDHKRIGIMYSMMAMVMLLRGFVDALMMRAQQAVAFQSQGYLPPDHYDQVFSAHGTIMIFFVAMPFIIGLMNIIVPLQLGVRDVAFPTLNSVSFWLAASGMLLVNISLVVGEFSQAGWLAYPPLSGIQYSPGVGVDYYIWALQISGVGTLMTGIKPCHHDPEDARPRHELFAHADVLLDLSRVQPAHRRRLPDPDGYPRHAGARPLPRLPLLHQ